MRAPQLRRHWRLYRSAVGATIVPAKGLVRSVRWLVGRLLFVRLDACGALL